MLMQELRSHFELQIFRGGRWIISAVYEDRDTALAEAWRLDRTGRLVRLKEESGNGSGARTVFISARIKETWKVERQRIAARARARPVSVSVMEMEAEPQRDESFHPYRLLALFTLIVALGLGAIFGLHSLYATI
jgi:hypothetical protein